MLYDLVIGYVIGGIGFILGWILRGMNDKGITPVGKTKTLSDYEVVKACRKPK